MAEVESLGGVVCPAVAPAGMSATQFSKGPSYGL